MNLTSSMERMISKFGYTINVVRAGGGDYINGKWKSFPAKNYSIQAVVQPLGFRELQLLPEGSRTRERIKIFSIECLRTQKEGQIADVVHWQGKQYKVVSVQTYMKPGDVFTIAYHRVDAEELHGGEDK